MESLEVEFGFGICVSDIRFRTPLGGDTFTAFLSFGSGLFAGVMVLGAEGDFSLSIDPPQSDGRNPGVSAGFENSMISALDSTFRKGAFEAVIYPFGVPQ